MVGQCTAGAEDAPRRDDATVAENGVLRFLAEQLHLINQPNGKVTQEEFDKARIGLKSGLVFAGESTGARAASIAADIRKIGRPRSLDELAQRIDAITLDELNAYLATRSLGTVTVQTLGPAELKCPWH